MPDRIGEAPEGARETIEAVSQAAGALYRAVVWDDPELPRFFRAFTPVDELSLLEIGSRPASRPEASGAGELESLRAIPWVFAWTQTRCIVPAWLGAGRGLEGVPPTELRTLFRDWPFFRALVENLEMSLAKSSMGIAEGYLELVGDDALAARVFGVLREEHDRARDAVLDDRRGARAPRPPPGAAAVGPAAEPLRRPDERDPGRAAQAVAGRRRERAPAAPALDRGDRGGAPQHRLSGQAAVSEAFLSAR